MDKCTAALANLDDFMIPQELKKRRVIGIGEVVHGSGGLHDLTARLIKKMIIEFGVRTILFEAPYGAVEKINSLIGQGRSVSATSLADLYFVWRSRENLNFFNWLSEFNRGANVPVRIIGIDIRQPAAELASLNAYLLSKGRAVSTELGDFPISEPSLQAFREFEKQLMMSKQVIGRTQLIRAQDQISAIAREIHEDKGLSDSRRSELEFYVNKLSFWLRMYGSIWDPSHHDDGFLVRDQGMYFSTNYYLKENQAPVVLWAHLGHLMFENSPSSLVSKHSFLTAGDLLGASIRSNIGNEYSVIAVMSRETGVANANGRQRTFVAKSTSLEHRAPGGTRYLNILTPKDLASEESITIGSLDDESDPLRETYIELKVKSSGQFDYAAIIDRSDPMIEAK